MILSDELNATYRLICRLGACRGLPPEVMFPLGEKQYADIAAAKAVCALCHVTDRCRSWAFETCQEFGVWGALDEWERAKIRRQERAVA